MRALTRLAFIGNSLPRRCGIATFTTDLQQAVAKSRLQVETSIVAITDPGHLHNYPSTVRFQINEQILDDYIRAADYLNSEHFDIVCLQHEFGIFGGDAGSYILPLLSRLTMPVVTTLHTVLAEPRPEQREVLSGIIDASSKLIVMADKAHDLLRTVYQVPADKIEVIPHGIPHATFVEPDAAKTKLGFNDKAVILTFGLLSPNKGIEVMIDAMPSIMERRADAVYVVLGATHPNLIRREGETYRENLMTRARARGVEDHVVFLNQFVDHTTLLDYISMCDIYVTPYLTEAQMTSGTLSYSFGLGKAVVSTPYWHARELLADGRGVLVPFGDSETIGAEIAALLTDDERRLAMRKRAYSSSRSMTWERTAKRYFAVFDRAHSAHPFKRVSNRLGVATLPEISSTPPVQLSHLLTMCDDTGLSQHALYSVPDRSHGYCVDDNARALLVACALNGVGEEGFPEPLTARFAAFVQHAWNPDKRRFRNFMSFDRRWLEEIGSEDSHGRALWALGECARSDASPSRRRWAARLFESAIPAVEHFRSPRAWAFTLLGLNSYRVGNAGNRPARELASLLGDRLVSMLSSVEAEGWVWFENSLSYDNARLPQALIETGMAIAMPTYVAAGLRSLRWLMRVQTTPTGLFRPVGSESFCNQYAPPHPFDQQPLEATATISACLAAWRADGNPKWKNDAMRAFSWFVGGNDLSLSLIDPDTGGCCDGLHPDRVNENRGGESVVSYLLSLTEIRQLERTLSQPTDPALLSVVPV